MIQFHLEQRERAGYIGNGKTDNRKRYTCSQNHREFCWGKDGKDYQQSLKHGFVRSSNGVYEV